MLCRTPLMPYAPRIPGSEAKIIDEYEGGAFGDDPCSDLDANLERPRSICRADPSRFPAQREERAGRRAFSCDGNAAALSAALLQRGARDESSDILYPREGRAAVVSILRPSRCLLGPLS